MLTKFLSFAFIGSIATVAHYAVLYELVERQGFGAVSASSCGAFIGMLVSYILNFKLTFQSQQSHLLTFPKFAAIGALGFALNFALMALLTKQLYYFYAQILTTLVLLLWNFFANMIWTFDKDNTANLPKASPMGVFQNVRLGLMLLLALLMIRLGTLAFYPLYDPSESRYAEMARKMLETGNWVTPLIDYGVPFWGKPPLTVWITALSLGIGGINEFFARLPSVFLGVGIVWIIVHLVKVQRNISSAVSTAVILASSVAFFVMSGAVAMDQCLTFGITLALASFWLALREDKSVWGYLFFIGLSIGILAKGPITLVLTGLTLGLWTLITGRWADIWQRIPWITGALLMLGIAVPWFLLAESRTPGFLEYFIIGEHWKRFTESAWTGDLYGVGHAQARGTIWIYWFWGAFPWSLLLLKKITTALLKRQVHALDYIREENGWRLYCLLWMLSPLLFFSFSANIIWTYVLPGIPGLALLLCDWFDGSKKYRTILALFVPLAFLGAVIYYHMPSVDFFKSQQQLVSAYQRQATDDERLIYFHDMPYSAKFYLQDKVSMVVGYELLQKSLNSPKHHYYVFHQDDLSQLPASMKGRLVTIKHYGRFVLLHAAAGA